MNDPSNTHPGSENQAESDSPKHEFREIPGARRKFGIVAIRECVSCGIRQEYVFDGVYDGWFDEKTSLANSHSMGNPNISTSNPESKEDKSPQELLNDFIEDFAEVFPENGNDKIVKISHVEGDDTNPDAYMVFTEKTKFPNKTLGHGRTAIFNHSLSPEHKGLYDKLAQIESAEPSLLEDNPGRRSMLDRVISKLASQSITKTNK